jgi:hypothetical protein
MRASPIKSYVTYFAGASRQPSLNRTVRASLFAGNPHLSREPLSPVSGGKTFVCGVRWLEENSTIFWIFPSAIEKNEIAPHCEHDRCYDCPDRFV